MEVRCCLGCRERKIGCHGKYARYQAEALTAAALARALQKEKQQQSDADNVLHEGARRAMKRRRGRL